MSIETKPVIVGYDGSAESRIAVEWAVAVANRRGAPLQVLAATGVADAGDLGSESDLASVGDRLAERLAEEGAALAREQGAADVTAVGASGGAAAALVDASDGAQLVVVGHRGLGRLRSTRLGSVAFQVSTHAKCPVAVVRHSLRPLPTAEFPSVVGVDGSESSNIALDQAADWAADAGSLLRIVVAWRRPRVHRGGDPAGAAGQHELAQRAADLAATAAARVHSGHPDLRIEQVVAEGRASDVIVDAAADASLIIVGARGRGDFASLLLGSVSREVIQQADCAVYVVR